LILQSNNFIFGGKAIADVYCDYDTGNDTTGDGSVGTPYQTISKALSTLSSPIIESTNIKLVGTIASPQTYVESGDNILYLQGLRCRGGDVKLTILPSDWDDAKYRLMQSPFTSGTAWGPDEDSPVTIPPVDIKDCAGVEIRGVTTSTAAANIGAVSVYGSNDIGISYCNLQAGLFGLAVTDMSYAIMENCATSFAVIGAIAAYKSVLKIVGQNDISGCYRAGIVATNDGLVSIRCWEDNHAAQVTLIESSEAKKEYRGIGVGAGSKVLIDDYLNSDWQYPAQIQIVNLNEKKTGAYYGVELQEGGMFVGADKITFNSEDWMDGEQPTVPEGQQFVENQGEGTLVIKS
jgi:hypothetical protein